MSVFKKGNQSLAILKGVSTKGRNPKPGLYIGEGNELKKIATFSSVVCADWLDSLLTEWMDPLIEPDVDDDKK